MQVNQIYEIVNASVKEVLGETAVVNEDLSNVVDIGNEIFNAQAVDAYVKKLINHIGKVIFVNRSYTGSVPSVLMDGWEYGSILEKITAELPTATENSSWELEDGEDYSPNVFYQPKVSAKFYNSKVTFEVPISFTEIQVKQSFSSAEQLNGFISMLFNSVENAMTVQLNNLIMKTINNMTAETIANDLTVSNALDLSGTSVKAVNLLKLYNEAKGQSLTKDDALLDTEFIKYASYIINLYKSRISNMSTLFNVGGKERFTPADRLHIVLLTDFASASNVFLSSDTYHDEMVALPNYETVPFWQGSGLGYELEDISSINVKTSSGTTVEADGILGVMFDSDALGVANLDKRVTSNYNPKAEFYTNFYKLDAGFYNDLNENFVVFFMGEAAGEGE